MLENQNAYVDKIFNDEVTKLTVCEKGNRNNHLNKSSYYLGRFIGAGLLDRFSVEKALLQACEQNNLAIDDRQAVLKTIKSGIDSGKQNPWKDLSNFNQRVSDPIYKYVNEGGELLFEVERKNPTKEGEKKSFFQRRYDKDNQPIYGISEGQYELIIRSTKKYWKKLKAFNDINQKPQGKVRRFEQTKLVPYNLVQLLQGLKEQKNIYYTEGEKDADRLIKHKLIATTNPMGSNKEMPEYFYEYFKGAQAVVILEDNDEAGRKQTELLQKKIKPYAKQLVVIKLPNLSLGEDISNWLDMGNSINDLDKLVKEKLESMPYSQNNNKIKIINIKQFVALDLPPREMLLSPIIPRQGLCMVHAPRGVGKTYIALNIGYAIASGSKFLKWQAPKPSRVLYIDGEMPAIVMQERLSNIINSAENTLFDPTYLNILTPDLQNISMPNLSSIDGQKMLEDNFDHHDLIIIDNLATLAHVGKENESESWIPMQELALNLRRKGKSILFIHHSGKTGLQRGTSRKEDILDTVIALKHAKDYSPDEGARFEIHFEKNRGFYGDDAKPFEASLSLDGKWSSKDLEDKIEDQIIELTKEGLTCEEIGEIIGRNKSTVSRRQQKLKAQNKL